jgi:predicted phage tail protein
MFEILQNFEQTSARFSPIVLIGPGVAVVIVGLFVWLGGLGFRKVLAGVLGAGVGWICGFFISGRNIIAAAVSAVVATVVATILERIFMTILTASLAAVIAFFVLSGVYKETIISTREAPIEAEKTADQNVMISLEQTPEVIKAYIADFSAEAKQSALHMPIYGWAIIAALAVVMLGAGLLLRKPTSALCCAVLGTVLIFAGMILLLLYKGNMPVTTISQKYPYYAAVSGVMAAFGTFVQLLLGPRVGGRAKRKKKAQRDNEAPAKRYWRT